jgi:hypothetical protein
VLSWRCSSGCLPLTRPVGLRVVPVPQALGPEDRLCPRPPVRALALGREPVSVRRAVAVADHRRLSAFASVRWLLHFTPPFVSSPTSAWSLGATAPDSRGALSSHSLVASFDAYLAVGLTEFPIVPTLKRNPNVVPFVWGPVAICISAVR